MTSSRGLECRVEVAAKRGVPSRKDARHGGTMGARAAARARLRPGDLALGRGADTPACEFDRRCAVA